MDDETTLAVEASMARHPAGKAIVPCPACDGSGRLTATEAHKLAAVVTGKPAPLDPLRLVSG